MQELLPASCESCLSVAIAGSMCMVDVAETDSIYPCMQRSNDEANAGDLQIPPVHELIVQV